MNAYPRFARLASKVLAEALPEPPHPSEASRAAAIDALARALRSEQRRHAYIRYVAVGSIAAAGIAGALGATRLFGRGPRAQLATPVPPSVAVAGDAIGRALDGEGFVLHGGAELSLSEPKMIAPGDHVLAKAHARVGLSLPTGTHLVLADGGNLGIVAQGKTQIFVLDAGSVRAEVAKLKPGERFAIRTADAEVEVQGTTFRVERSTDDVACAPHITTRVAVDEGVVVVRSARGEERVAAGQKWPACEIGRAAPAASSDKPAPDAERARARPPAAAVSPSALALQNDFFARGMRAKKGGDFPRAVVIFERFLSEYPASPLAEHAAVERMRLLGAIDRARAASAARDYLAHYRNGYARDEAQAILAAGQ